MTAFPIPEAYTPQPDYEGWFWANATGPNCQRVLEVGTLQTVPGRSTHSMAGFPLVKPADYVRMDVAPGADVDVVGDLHALPSVWNDHFDAFVAIAVWEHLERPWIAAREVARTLAPDGKFLVITHQTFPLHGYPSDFFRFSREALRLLFEDAGLIVEVCDYKNRCVIAPAPAILPPDAIEGWNKTHPSFIHVGIAGRKPGRNGPRSQGLATTLSVGMKPSATSMKASAASDSAPPSANNASPPPAHSGGSAATVEGYEFGAPSHQNAIDLLTGWNTTFPTEMKLSAGAQFLYEDPRIHWAVEQFGSLTDKRVLELGPLEASHTYLLERYGARRIDAIEANKTAFLRCLVAKEVYGLRRARFELGDFVRGLLRPARYDLIVACGVLYHMSDPLLLLERMAARTDAIYLWTHYFDDGEMPKGDPRRGAFVSPTGPKNETTQSILFHGHEMTLHLRSYHNAWQNNKYCGGPIDRHFWLEKKDLILALNILGFSNLTFADEAPNHPNGPAISVFARRV